MTYYMHMTVIPIVTYKLCPKINQKLDRDMVGIKNNEISTIEYLE